MAVALNVLSSQMFTDIIQRQLPKWLADYVNSTVESYPGDATWPAKHWNPQVIACAWPKQCNDISIWDSSITWQWMSALLTLWQDPAWQTECQVNTHSVKSSDIIMHRILPSTSCPNMLVMICPVTVSACMIVIMIMENNDGVQWGERPYFEYTVHQCSSQWPRCFLHTFCLGVLELVSYIRDCAASRTDCCIRSIHSIHPSLRRLKETHAQNGYQW